MPNCREGQCGNYICCHDGGRLKSSAKCLGLLSEDKLTFDKKTVANIFNTFFTTVAASLVGKLPNITGGYAGHFVYKYH